MIGSKRRVGGMMTSGRNREAYCPPTAKRRLWPRSLHGRLVLIPSALLVVGLLCSITFIFLHAKSRIATEVTSSVQLAQGLATTALRNVAEADSAAVAFAALARDLPQVRHVRFGFESFGDTAVPAGQTRIGGV